MLPQKAESCLFFVAPGKWKDIFLGRGGGGRIHTQNLTCKGVHSKFGLDHVYYLVTNVQEKEKSIKDKV